MHLAQGALAWSARRHALRLSPVHAMCVRTGAAHACAATQLTRAASAPCDTDTRAARACTANWAARRAAPLCGRTPPVLERARAARRRGGAGVVAHPQLRSLGAVALPRRQQQEQRELGSVTQSRTGHRNRGERGC